MEPLEYLKQTIADFPGYADDEARRRSDELVRSYLGEAIANLQERLEADAAVNQRLGDLLIRTAFVNQAAYRSYEDDARTRASFDGMAAADARTVEIAKRAVAVDGDVSGYISQVVEDLDRRDGVMSGAAAAPLTAG